MAKWDTLSKPIDQGGLGIINTKIMNECLLVKWIWRIAKGGNETWYKLLEAKYMFDGNFFNSRCKGTSHFGKGYTKSSISLNGEPYTRCAMGRSPLSGGTLGWDRLH